MKTLKDVSINEIITVRKITGGRKTELELERFGIMPGSDLTVVEKDEATGEMKVSCCRGLVSISADQADCIKIGAHFIRKKDPVLLSGCCAGGNLSEFLERIEDNFDKPTD